jgi:hypothetical protein
MLGSEHGPGEDINLGQPASKTTTDALMMGTEMVTEMFVSFDMADGPKRFN